MPVTHDQFLADVAAVYAGDSTDGAFGSGRLIAPGLILTAGHVVDYPTRETPSRSGWKVVLLRNRMPDGSWATPAHTAERVWRGKGQLDLALLRVVDNPQPKPAFGPIFASYDLVGSLGEVAAVGFPEAWHSEAETVRDYSIHGVLRIASELGPYAWSVPPADKPDRPKGWKGMSGAGLCRVGPDDQLYLFGAVQQVPDNFSDGQLEAARLSEGFDDAEFRDCLKTALGAPPSISPFKLGQSRADISITRFFQSVREEFTKEYIVSEKGTVPFGGRDCELRRLDAWLLDPKASPRMLMTAPAGRGKSALIVHWMKNLQDAGVCGPNGWQLAFMPISIRAGTNLPGKFYEGLARRLAEITGEALPSEAIRDADGFRYAVREILDGIAKTNRRIIIVIDGLDEAPFGSFKTAILPTVMPATLRVLLSARWQLGDSDSKGWLERLEWDHGVKVDSCELSPLTMDGITDVLVRLGVPLNTFAQAAALVERLAQLTEGEPLLVRYYAEDLWSESNKGRRMTLADLENFQPGFSSYFKRWFELQDELWEREEIDPGKVDEVLMVLAFALGPLEQTDLLSLVKRIHDTKGLIAPDRLLKPLRRFVFGNGKRNTGYVLSHPKIGDYLQNERFVAIAKDLRIGFKAWGQAHLCDLNAGRVKSEQASSYVLQFLPEHLDQTQATPEDYAMMVEDGWRRAWEQFEGGQRGFAATVNAAWAAQRKDKTDLRLGSQWRCALTLSSIRSLGQNVPGELVSAAAKKGVLTLRQAAYIAELKGNSEDSVRLLVELAVAARDNPELSTQLTYSALAKALTLQDTTERAALLNNATEIPGLTPQLKNEILSDALAAAKAIGDEFTRSRVLAALAPQLTPEQLDEALAAAKAIGEKGDRSETLAALARHLPPEKRAEALSDALAAAKTIGDELSRSRVLSALAPHLTPEKRNVVLRDAFVVAKAIRDECHRYLALEALAPHLTPEQLGEALATAKAIGEEYFRGGALSALAPHIAPEQLGEALVAAKAIGNEYPRSQALAALAPHLPPEKRDEIAHEALAAAKAIVSEDSRSRALAELAQYLAREQPGVALAAARAIGDEFGRSQALAALAPHLAPKQLGEALAIAKAIVSEDHRSRALAALAPRLAPKQLGEALAVAKATVDEFTRSRALAALAPHLAPKQLGEALAAATAIIREHRSATLAALAPHLAPEQLGQALAAAKAIGDEFDRSQALAALAFHLAPEKRAEAIGEALAAARAIGDEHSRSLALAALSYHVAPEERGQILREALAAATAIGGERRSQALAELARHLAPEQRAEAIGEALAAARAISNEFTRSQALAALAPHLAPKQLGEALAIAKAIVSEDHRSRALAALAPDLVRRRPGKALAAAKAIGDEHQRARLLAALAPDLALKQLGEALAAAKAIRDERCRADVLVALAFRLASRRRDGMLNRALAAAKAVGDEHTWLSALAALAHHFTPQLRVEILDEALAAAKAIVNEFHRFHVLAALALNLAPEQRDEVIREALAATKTIGDEDHRAQVLAALVRGFPVTQKGDTLLALIDAAGHTSRRTALAAAAAGARTTFELGGQAALLELRRAINDACRWYP